MKTVLTRLKTLVKNNGIAGGTLSYVKSVEVIHPDLDQTMFSVATLPKISFVPVSTREEWVSTQRKQATHVVTAYLMLQYHQREGSILGDASRAEGQAKGIMDFVIDFLTVARGHRLAVDGENYLDKPLDVTNIDYMVENLGENGHLLVAAVTLLATRLFTQATLPGNI